MSYRRHAFVSVFALVCASGLAGCSGPNLLTGSISPAAQAPSMLVGNSVPLNGFTLVSTSPVAGAPEAVQGKIAQALNGFATPSNVALIHQQEGDVGLKGFAVATKEGPRVKVTFSWEAFSRATSCANRTPGSRTVNSDGSADPWLSVTDDVIREIAAQGFSTLQACMPKPAAVPAKTAAPT